MIYLINPRLHNIYACISFITLFLYYFDKDYGKDFVPKPIDIIYLLYVYVLYRVNEHITVSLIFGYFLYFVLYVAMNWVFVCSIIQV
jgi:hypothetical protein